MTFGPHSIPSLTARQSAVITTKATATSKDATSQWLTTNATSARHQTTVTRHASISVAIMQQSQRIQVTTIAITPSLTAADTQ